MAVWPRRKTITRRREIANDMRKILARYSGRVDDQRSAVRLDDLAELAGRLGNLIALETGQDHMESRGAVSDVHMAHRRLIQLREIAKSGALGPIH